MDHAQLEPGIALLLADRRPHVDAPVAKLDTGLAGLTIIRPSRGRSDAHPEARPRSLHNLLNPGKVVAVTEDVPPALPRVRVV
jgi:hypothetical protein